MEKIFSIVIGYFIGCILSAYVVGKVMKVDLREHGSGNLGSTNALRVLGKKAGFITFACDILKSVAAYLICSLLFKGNIQMGGPISTVGMYGCFGAVLGHDFPFYLKFSGGKGVATMIGMVFCIGVSSWQIPLIVFGIGIVGLLTRYVSVGSAVFSISIPIIVYIFSYSMEIVILTAVLSALAIYRHRPNIIRLINGTENRLGTKPKVQSVNSREQKEDFDREDTQ